MTYIEYSDKRLHNQAEKIIKKINKLKYIHGLNESEFDWTDDAKDWRKEYIKFTEDIVKELNQITKRVWGDRLFVDMFEDRMSRIIRNATRLNYEISDYPIHYQMKVVDPLIGMVSDITNLAFARSRYLEKPKEDRIVKGRFGVPLIEDTIYLEFRTQRRLILNYIDESIHNIAGIPEPRLNSLKKLLRHFK